MNCRLLLTMLSLYRWSVCRSGQLFALALEFSFGLCQVQAFSTVLAWLGR